MWSISYACPVCQSPKRNESTELQNTNAQRNEILLAFLTFKRFQRLIIIKNIQLYCSTDFIMKQNCHK